MTCCCTKPKPVCTVCNEGSNVLIDNGVGFLFDGETAFAGVTDSTSLFVIPNGCVTDGHSTACIDALSSEFKLARLLPGLIGETCVDYFGNTIDCEAETCWWSATAYRICPNDCTVGPASVCAGGPRGSDQLQARIIIDASTDPDYVILIVQLTSDWGRYHCCIDGEYGTGAHPLYQMRTFYRVAKEDFTCLCAVCFAKYDEQLIAGAEVPCLNLPDHIRVNVRAGGATDEQYAEAQAKCNDPAYQANVDCPVPSPCGETACSYTAQFVVDVLKWVYQSGVCSTGCICPDHDALIALGRPQPVYENQALTVNVGCVPGSRPCSTIIGRCCYTDEDGIHCSDIDECDCQELGGCWEVGTGIDCDHLDVGRCACTEPVGICCYPGEDEVGHCVDDVTQAACNDLDGSWVEQNEAGDFSCAGDRGGLTGCGCECGQCSWLSFSNGMGGFFWNQVDCSCTGDCNPVQPPISPTAADQTAVTCCA